jgi:hypothetical protein
MPTLTDLKKQQAATEKLLLEIKKKVKKQHKAYKKEQKIREKKVDLNYHDKQKVLKKAKSDGYLNKKKHVNVKSKLLNKLIIKAAKKKMDESESESESESETEDSEAEAEDDGFIPIRDTIDEVKKQLEKKKIEGKFRVQFTSYLNNKLKLKVPKELPFNALKHYENFINVLDKEEVEPLNSSATIKALAQLDDVLKYVKVKVLPIKGGCNKHIETERIIKTPLYKLTLHNPVGQNNNCGLKCIEKILNIKLEYKPIRNKYKLNDGLIDTYTLNKIYNEYKKDKDLKIIEESYNDKFDLTKFDYFFLMNKHYYLVLDIEFIDQTNKSTKRGLLVWDCETRQTEDTVDINHFDRSIINGETIIEKKIIKSKIIKDTITCAAYKDYKSNEIKQITFETDAETTSIRKFINFLKAQSKAGKHYNCVAHNSARFDHYFLLGEMSETEQLQTEYQLRGYSVIGLQFCSHLFKDSCCFLLSSLKNLCDSFKTTIQKKSSFQYNGKKMNNEQLCFYKPELEFNDFLNLRDEEPKFWKLYTDYCMYDCLSLMEVWEKFSTETNKLISNMDNRLLKNCNISACNTIGSLAMKLVKNINNFIENKNNFKELVEFIDSDEKFHFVNGTNRLNSQKTGGISHCHMKGHHKEAISSVDIASQYPAAMMNMKIPVGTSKFVTKYCETKYGFYQLEDLEFDCEYKFKPICVKKEGESLNWITKNTIKDMVCIDSWMIKYLKKHYGLKSFKVKKGLVSDDFIDGSKLFGVYIDTLYKEKAQQDKYKSTEPDKYNQALRETIKLLLNSLSGKLNEEVHKYFSVKVSSEDTGYKIGAINFEKEKTDKYNKYITAGVMLYSYSKRLLFEYIRLLPDNSDSVIHIETDSIYFKTKDKDEFLENIKNYTGNYPVKLGSDLGNVKFEKDNVKDSYFLGKKFYFIPGTKMIKDKLEEDTMKIKGIPAKTINPDGSEKKLVNKQLYIDIYNNIDVTKTFMTLKKQLFNEKILISSHEMSRTIKPDPKGYDSFSESDSDSDTDSDSD